MNWSVEKIIALAPDEITGERGKELASARRWASLDGNEKLIWGQCRASRGNFHYQTIINPITPSFKCSCPSTKFPCKHVIGLFLLFLNDKNAFQIMEVIPDWVEQLLAGAIVKTSPVPSKGDPEKIAQQAANKTARRSERLALMSQGVTDLEVWLSDIIRQGMASTEGQSYGFWQDISTRMVDTKLGGLGPRIRSLQLIHTTYPNWPERMLEELSELYLIASGLNNLEKLPIPMQEQLLRIAGVKMKRIEVLEQEGTLDEWGVIGEFEGVNIDNAGFRRTWLRGKNTRKIGLILEYNYQNRGYQTQWKVGSIYEGSMMYYPAAFPLRAVFKDPTPTGNSVKSLKGYPNVEAFRTDFAKALAQNPWLSNFPCCLEKVIPVMKKEDLLLVDQEKNQISTFTKNQDAWKILALSGGHPITLFGEWTEENFVPLSVYAGGRFVVI